MLTVNIYQEKRIRGTAQYNRVPMSARFFFMMKKEKETPPKKNNVTHILFRADICAVSFRKKTSRYTQKLLVISVLGYHGAASKER